MAGYSREFLVDAYVSRFHNNPEISVEQLCSLENIAYKYFDEVGKDKFRDAASLDASAIRAYKNELAKQ